MYTRTKSRPWQQDQTANNEVWISFTDVPSMYITQSTV